MTATLPGESLPPAGRRVLVIYNSAAGWRRRWVVGAALAHLAEQGCAVTVRQTAGPGDAEAFARNVDTSQVDVVVAAGGDGTINAVVNGLIERGDGLLPPVGILPVGTANVLARELGLPRRSPAAMAAVIARGQCRTVHLGNANGRRFLLMAGAGFDAAVATAVSPRLKRRLGALAYGIAALAQLRRHRPRRYRVVLDGRVDTAFAVVVANARGYGGPFTVAPQARLDDPTLHACLFERGNWLAVLRYGFGLLTGLLARYRDVRVVPARTVRIEGVAGEPVQLDGEAMTMLPVDIALAPEQLRLLVP